ncbi:hypothetical protein QBC39DRAFT_64856 [Podospora conica]|nr:hypothetical protein QBC39DRAFT_64856 [Schizothecium conicum]
MRECTRDSRERGRGRRCNKSASSQRPDGMRMLLLCGCGCCGCGKSKFAAGQGKAVGEGDMWATVDMGHGDMDGLGMGHGIGAEQEWRRGDGTRETDGQRNGRGEKQKRQMEMEMEMQWMGHDGMGQSSQAMPWKGRVHGQSKPHGPWAMGEEKKGTSMIHDPSAAVLCLLLLLLLLGTPARSDLLSLVGLWSLPLVSSLSVFPLFHFWAALDLDVESKPVHHPRACPDPADLPKPPLHPTAPNPNPTAGGNAAILGALLAAFDFASTTTMTCAKTAAQHTLPSG